MLNFRSIDPLIELAFEEDIGIGDITTESTVAPLQQGLGTILTETEGRNCWTADCEACF